jgi:lauroyl/myristoyl acyltransferase
VAGPWITYIALRLAVAILGVLPEPVMRRLGWAAGLAWYVADPSRRRVVRRHMLRLGQPAARAREVFVSYGRYWAESFWVRPRRLSRLWSTMTVEGLEHLEKALAGGKGAIVVLPHLGNWEAAALIGVHLRVPLVAVAESLANRHITAWFTSQRQMFGIEIILTGKGRVSARLRRAIEEEKLVCLLADRDLSGRGVAVEFFGERTTLPAGPVILAQRTGAPLLPAGVYFKDGPGHHAVIHPPLDLPTGDVAGAVQVVAHQLERMIMRSPGQWHMVQPNWPSDKA